MQANLSPDVAAPTELKWRPPAVLKPYAGNARTHSRKQIDLGVYPLDIR